MGVFEDPRFAAGTEAIARAVAASRRRVGGRRRRFGGRTGRPSASRATSSFVSTGGGASLELVELGDLPGLRALRESPFN